MSKIFSVGDLARELEVPEFRVTYLLKTRRHIRPIGKLGSNRVFDSRALRQLAVEVNEDRRRRD
jgi:hypothetical protein